MENQIKNKVLFQSPPFFKKYSLKTNVYESNHSKLLILLVFLFVFMLLSIGLFIGGYITTMNESVIPIYEKNGEQHFGLDSASPIYLNPQPLKQSFRTMRALGLVSISWWLMVQIWIIKLGINMITHGKFNNNSYERKMGYLYTFSFLAIYNFGLIIYEITKIKNTKLSSYIKTLFQNLNSNFYYETRKYWTYYLACIMLGIMLPLIWFILFPRTNSNNQLVFLGTSIGYGSNWWFYALQFFTEQTNLMCFFTLLAYVINPKWKIFKNYDLWTIMISYIVIVSLTYNLAIFPIIASSYKGEYYDLTRTLWLHVVDPIAFVTCGCCLYFHNQTKKITPWGDVVKYGMIIPSIYSIYALLSPYVTGVSPYAYLTNTNPSLVINNIKGSWFCLFFFIIFMSFFIGFLTLWWYVNTKLSIKKYGYSVLSWINDKNNF